jgi:hypothetical protein
VEARRGAVKWRHPEAPLAHTPRMSASGNNRQKFVLLGEVIAWTGVTLCMRYFCSCDHPQLIREWMGKCFRRMERKD